MHLQLGVCVCTSEQDHIGCMWNKMTPLFMIKQRSYPLAWCPVNAGYNECYHDLMGGEGHMAIDQ